MKRKSPFLFFISSILLVFVGISMILFRNYAGIIQNDASTLNRLGVIRGSIQRFSKLELAGADNGEVRVKINDLIEQFNNKEIPFIEDLREKWTELQAIAELYSNGSGNLDLEMFLKKSEECWAVADQMVLENQYKSEHKISYLTLPITLLAFGLAVAFLLLFIIKKYVHDSLEVSAIYDPLTKVFNRRYFIEYLSHEIQRANRMNTSFCLIMFDIDHFKKVNDTFGHNVGDEVLEAVAAIAGKTIRKSDVLSRIGGEEFVILLPDIGADQAFQLAERIRRNIEEHTYRHLNKVTISLGVTSFQKGNLSEDMMQRVDNALYKAKDNGRNRTEVVL